MRRTIALALACALAPAIAAAQNPPVQQASMQTAAAKIASAMTAAPMAVSAQATIMDWPSTPNGQPAELRHGSNGWVCFPDMPQTQGNDPMCMDAQWQKWGEAYMTHAAPQITGLGIGYMLTASGEGSNTDPYAMARTSDNEWGSDPPHIMLVVPDPHMLDGLPTNRDNGGPWVMYRGTPYVHVMVPTTPAHP